jgi:hypothetical protein
MTPGEDNTWPTPKSPYGVTARQRDFGAALQKLAVMYSSPIILTRPHDRTVYHNGTGFLFKPGGRTFLITNAHVLDKGYFPLRESYPDLVMIFANRAVDAKIIAKNSDDGIDLAVIDVDGIEFDKEAPGYWGSSAAKLTTYAPASWPFAPPRSGEPTAVVGWPGKFRRHEESSTEFAAFPLLGSFIDAVEDTLFTIRFDRDGIIASDFDPNNKEPVTETSFGGMSGSPVFALHRPGINPLQLVGVLRAYGPLLDGLYCTRADLIRADGTLAA